jgi:hypothetical protein
MVTVYTYTRTERQSTTSCSKERIAKRWRLFLPFSLSYLPERRNQLLQRYDPLSEPLPPHPGSLVCGCGSSRSSSLPLITTSRSLLLNKIDHRTVNEPCKNTRMIKKTMTNLQPKKHQLAFGNTRNSNK